MQVLIVGADALSEEVSAILVDAGNKVVRVGTRSEMDNVDPEEFDLLILIDLKPLGELLGQSLGSVHSRVCLAHKPLADQLHDVIQIDDLFSSVKELADRLPFIERRVGIRETRQREYAALFKTTVDGIIIIDSVGKIESFNSAASTIFGYTLEEVIGKNVSMLMPSPHREQHDTYLSNYLTTGHAKIIGIGREVSGRRKDGSLFPMDLAVSEVRKHGDVFFTGVVRDITERRRLEHEVLRISEQERRRIGQDLHDGLGQMLTGIGLICQNLARQLTEVNSSHAEDLLEITDLVREADGMARNLARGLVQVELEGDGLKAALRTLCQNAERFFDVSCSLDISGDLTLGDSGAASNLYRIAQEAISNAVKHGRASEIQMTVKRSGTMLELVIDDNGIGFPKKLSEDRGMGVDIMGYRARVIGGMLAIRARPQGGTTVRCVVSSVA